MMAEDLKSEAEITEILANEIFDKIQKGEPVAYDRVRIIGDLDLSKLNLPTETIDLTEIKKPWNVLLRDQKRNIISSPIKITNSEFKGAAIFALCSFKAKVDLMGTNFKKHANFIGTKFNDVVNFTATEFGGEALYFVATFNKNALFDSATFGNDAGFNGAKFKNDTSFIGARFKEDALFESVDFERELHLEKTRYKRLFVRWETISEKIYVKTASEDYDDTTFLLLIDNFKNLGYFEDADNCYYSYRKARRQQLPKIYRIFDWILWLFYGYGVKPLRPLGGLVVLLFAFVALYSYFGVAGNSTMDLLNTSLTLSLAGTKLIDDPNHPATWVFYWIFTVEKLLASLFFAMFLVSIGRTIIR
jgi:hypothetical protein